jgi:hypothetical protein
MSDEVQQHHPVPPFQQVGDNLQPSQGDWAVVNPPSCCHACAAVHGLHLALMLVLPPLQQLQLTLRNCIDQVSWLWHNTTVVGVLLLLLLLLLVVVVVKVAGDGQASR